MALDILMCLGCRYLMRTGLSWKYWRFSFLLLNGFSQQLYFLVLVAIAILWRPSPNSKLIAYAEQIGEEDYGEPDAFSLELDEHNMNPTRYDIVIPSHPCHHTD